jgi:hypothetical protein
LTAPAIDIRPLHLAVEISTVARCSITDGSGRRAAILVPSVLRPERVEPGWSGPFPDVVRTPPFLVPAVRHDDVERSYA